MINPDNYWTILRKADDLYQAGRFQEVIDFLNNGVEEFPDLKPAQFYTQICAATKLEKYDVALAIFKQLLDEGGWYSEMILRQSPSLQPLQGMPEFEKLLNISVERSKEDSKKDYNLTAIPDNIKPPYPLILALHAGGGLVKEEFEVWKAVVDHGYVLGMPRSTTLFWSGKDGANWFDYEESAEQVKTYAEKLNNDHPLDPERSIVGGLSAGAALAIKLALTGILSVRGFVVVAPGGPEINEPEKWQWQSIIDNAKNSDLRGIIIRGEEDRGVPREGIQKLTAMINDGGIPCKFIEYPELGHWYPPDFVEVVTSFVADLD